MGVLLFFVLAAMGTKPQGRGSVKAKNEDVALIGNSWSAPLSFRIFDTESRRYFHLKIKINSDLFCFFLAYSYLCR